jgi:hypothetical protein
LAERALFSALFSSGIIPAGARERPIYDVPWKLNNSTSKRNILPEPIHLPPKVCQLGKERQEQSAPKRPNACDLMQRVEGPW